MSALVLPLVAVGLLASCGSLEEPGTEGPRDTASSSPFEVGTAPAGYGLVSAGAGSQPQAWGDDSTGTDEPFTVLAPEGADASSPAAVVVSVTGFEGYESGLDQAAGGYVAVGVEPDRFEIDGRSAIFTPARTFDRVRAWADLVAVRGDDLAVRVTGRDATKDELIDVLRGVRPPVDHRHAPAVPDPPAGLRVVGSVDADVVVGFAPEVLAHGDSVPGTVAAHSAGWADGRRVLAVMTLPGRDAALAALPGYARFAWRDDFTARSRAVGGRPGVVINTSNTGGGVDYHRRAVVAQAAWGDLVMVAATGDEVPSEDTLVELAASVRRVGDAAWEEFLTRTFGGPGLHPDAGAIELARGKAGDLEWLLQARELTGFSESIVIAPGLNVDPCLKLSNHHRVCATSGSSGSLGAVLSTQATVAGDQQDFAFPGFVLVSTRSAGARVRVTTAVDTWSGDLVRIPGTELWAGIAFVDRPGFAVCAGPLTPSPSFDVMRVDVLDASGRPMVGPCFRPDG